MLEIILFAVKIIKKPWNAYKNAAENAYFSL